MPNPHKCDICGAEVPRGSEPVTVSGWYSGHHYVWRNGILDLKHVRCEQHPYDERIEDLEMQAALDELKKED